MSMGNLLFKFLWIVLLCSFEGSARRKWWLSKPESPFVKKYEQHVYIIMRTWGVFLVILTAVNDQFKWHFAPPTLHFLEQNSGLRTFPDIFEGRERERQKKKKPVGGFNPVDKSKSRKQSSPAPVAIYKNVPTFLKNRYPLVLSRRTKGTN